MTRDRCDINIWPECKMMIMKYSIAKTYYYEILKTIANFN